MICVLDASAGFELLTASDAGKNIRFLLEKAESVLSPDLYLSEIANTLWKAVKAKELSFDKAQTGLRTSISLVDILVSSSLLINEALSEACIHTHPVYDMLYFTLARREGATLISLDKKLCSIAKKSKVRTARI